MATAEIVQARWYVERIETHEDDFGRLVRAIASLRSDIDRAMRLEVTEVVDSKTPDRLTNGKNSEQRAVMKLSRWIRELGYMPDFHIIFEAKENRLFLTTAFGDIATVAERLRVSPDEEDSIMFYSVPRRDYHPEEATS